VWALDVLQLGLALILEDQFVFLPRQMVWLGTSQPLTDGLLITELKCHT
jgi:hypothetical protein